LISSLLAILTVLLLLLRKLHLVLLLLVLTLMLVLVTLLEWLRWVAWVAGMAATPDLRSSNLAFPVLYLPMLPFNHNCSVDQMLEGREGVVHQLVMEGINQSSQEAVLPLVIRVNIFWGIMWQLQKLVHVLVHGQGTLLQGEKLLLPHYHQSLGHMVATEVVPKFLPGDGFRVGMGGEVRLPPRLCCSPQLSGTIQHLLTIVALGSVQLTLHGMQPIFGVHGISRMGKDWDGPSLILPACPWAPVASELAPEAEVGVATAAPATSLLKSVQLLGLLVSASGTFSQWSSVVAVATAIAELHPHGVPAVLAEHAMHLCAYSQTSVEITHIYQIYLCSLLA
jgi:hypothetical protein